MTIDELDARIVEVFAAEPRVGVLECSRRLGVARGTVQARLDRMTRDGVIRGWGPELDPAAMGYVVTAFVTLEIRQQAGPGARRAGRTTPSRPLGDVPEVLEAHTTTGAGDMLVRVVARSNADLQRVIDRVLAATGVVRASTVIALDTQISARVLPLLHGLPPAEPPAPTACRGRVRPPEVRRAGKVDVNWPHAGPAPNARIPPCARRPPPRARSGGGRRLAAWPAAWPWSPPAAASAAGAPAVRDRPGGPRPACGAFRGARPRPRPGRRGRGRGHRAVVWGRTTHEAQIPASNAKILTAVNALEVFGPSHTFTTSVWTGATSRQVVLYGGGDPSLSRHSSGRWPAPSRPPCRPRV